jgi:hypothetical protein
MSLHFTRYSWYGVWIGDCVTEKWMVIGVECPWGNVIRSWVVAQAPILNVSDRPPHQ